jgi:hypothetical protein
MMIRRITMLVAAALSAPVALAAQEPPPGCTKDKGTWTCTTKDEPGNSDTHGQEKQPVAIVEDETQGNLSNKSPEESQDLADNECTQGSPGLCKQAARQ